MARFNVQNGSEEDVQQSESPQPQARSEVISFEGWQKLGYDVDALERLNMKYKPRMVIRIINEHNPEDAEEFIVRRSDPMLMGDLNDSMILSSLARLSAVQKMTEKDFEGLSEEELSTLFDVGQRLEDIKAGEEYNCLAASKCLLKPKIPHQIIADVLPMEIIKLIADVGIGGATDVDQSVSGFRIEITGQSLAAR